MSKTKPTYEELLLEISTLKNKLIQKEECLDSFLAKAIPDAIFLLDKDGKFLSYIPPKNFETYVPPEVFLGKNITDIFEKDLANKFLNKISKVLETKSIEIMDYSLLEKGESKHYETRFVISGHNNIIAIVRDKTEEILNKKILKEIEEKFFNIFNLSPDSIIITKLDDGTFLDVNDSFCNLIGYSKDEIIGRTTVELEIFKFKSERDDFIAKFNNSESIRNLEISFSKKNGDLVIVSISSSIIHLGNDLCLISNLKDITKKVYYENKLKESEEKYRTLIENTTEMICIESNNTLLFVNNTMSEILGYSKEELESKDFTSLIHADDKNFVKEKQNNRLNGIKGNSFYSCRLLDKNQNVLWVEVSSVIVNWNNNKSLLVFLSDITERKLRDLEIENKNKMLIEAELKFRLSFENAPHGMALVLLNGKFIQVNKSLCNMLEYSEQELLEKDFQSITYHEDLEKDLNLTQKLLKGQFDHYEIEKRYTNKYNKIIWAILSVSIVRDLDNNPLYFVSQIVDITERKETEKKLKYSEKKFRNLFNYSPDMILLTDFSNSVIIDVNEKFLNLTKYKKEDVIDKTTVEINLWANLKDRNAYRYILEKYGYVRNFEADFLLKSGEKRNGLLSATIVSINDEKYILATLRDITEQREIQNRLNDERIRLKTVLETIPDLIWLKDMNGTYLACNSKFEQLYGARERDIVGKTDFDFLDKETAEFFRNNDKRAILSELPSKNVELLTYKSDGHKEYCITIKTPMYDSKGNLIGVLGIARDITELYQAQQDIRDREEIYSAIVNQANESIVLIDLENYNFVQFNESAYTSLGYTKDEFKNLSLNEIEDNINESLLFVKESKKGIFETKQIKKDGSCFDVRASFKKIKIKDKNYLSLIWSDITEEKAFEKNLIDTINELAIFKKALDHISSYIYMKDINSNYIYANKPTLDLFGCSEDNLKGCNDFKFFSKETAIKLREIDKKVLNGKETIEEITTNFMNGETRSYLEVKTPIYYNGNDKKIWGLCGISTDITHQKDIENKLRKSEAKLKEAQKLAKLGHWELDLITNKLSWSDEIFEIFQIDPLKFGASYESFLNTIHPEDRESVNKSYTDSVKNKNSYDIVHRLLMKDGSIKYVHEMGKTYYDEFGNPLVSIGTVQDITDRVQIENEIRELNQTLEEKVKERTEQLETANKDLESFAYSVSHDLRAPLRHIDGFTKLLKRFLKDPNEDVINYFSKIEESAKKMSRMIEDLLKFSRLGRKQLELVDVDLNKIVKTILEQYKPDIENRNIEFKIGTLPIVKGDIGLLQIVFENLISNAIKFTSKKDLAIIEIDTCKNCSKGFNIYIKDNGAGFDMSYSSKLFGVFQRLHTESEFSGTGIGLANVKQILKKHGGNIHAESEVDNGATFFISL